jgi:hypothetical protein
MFCQGGEKTACGTTYPSTSMISFTLILSRNKLYLNHSSVVNSEASVAGEGQRQVHVICVSLGILFSIQISKIFWELVCASRLVTIARSPIHFRTVTQVGCNYFMYEIPCVTLNLSTSRHPEF